jgi:hypothetical protein
MKTYFESKASEICDTIFEYDSTKRDLLQERIILAFIDIVKKQREISVGVLYGASEMQQVRGTRFVHFASDLILKDHSIEK